MYVCADEYVYVFVFGCVGKNHEGSCIWYGPTTQTAQPKMCCRCALRVCSAYCARGCCRLMFARVLVLLVSGSPVYKVISGQSRCRTEAGTLQRDDPQVNTMRIQIDYKHRSSAYVRAPVCCRADCVVLCLCFLFCRLCDVIQILIDPPSFIHVPPTGPNSVVTTALTLINNSPTEDAFNW